MQRPSQNHRRGITALEVVITIIILLMLATLFLPAVQIGCGGSRRSSCKNNLKQFGLALHNYHEVHNTFPPGWIANRQPDAVNPVEGYSWVVPAMGRFETGSLARDVDFHGSLANPENAELVNAAYSAFRCPSETANAIAKSDTFSEMGTTNYVGVFGVGRPSAIQDARACQGIFGCNSRVRIRDIKDGTTNVIMVGERRLVSGGIDWKADAAEGSFNSYWAGIPNLNTDSPLCIVGTTMTGNPTLHGDGDGLNSTGHINALLQPGLFPSFQPLGINRTVSGDPLPTTRESLTVFEQLSGKEARTFGTSVTGGFSSWHVGGAQFLLCDGSVKFVSENVDSQTLVNISRRADGQTVGPF